MAAFRFIDPGPLIDGELELVTPDVKWVDALLAACSHPLSQNDPGAASMTRARALEWLRAAPGGHQNPDPHTGRVPSYNFWMRLRQISAPGANTSLPRWGEAPPPVEIAGGLGLRIGSTYDLEMYLGHIGYNVYPPARGNHYAERSCRLLLNIARAH